METTMTVYRIGQPPEVRGLDIPRAPGLWELRSLVLPCLEGAGHFEHVHVTMTPILRASMFVDEDGVAKRLPVNPEATAHYRHGYLMAHPATPPESLPAIHGPAVLFDRCVWF